MPLLDWVSSSFNASSASNASVTEDTVKPWSMLVFPGIILSYLVICTICEALTCHGHACMRDLKELVKAGLTLVLMATSTAVLPLSVQIIVGDTKLGPDLVLRFEWLLVLAVTVITIVTSVRSFQTTYASAQVSDADGWRSESVYSDLSDRSMVKALVVFTGQVILVIFLMGGVFANFEKIRKAFPLPDLKGLHTIQVTELKPSQFTVFMILSAFLQTLLWDQMGDSFEDSAPIWKTFWFHFRGHSIQVFDTTVKKGQRSCWDCKCIEEKSDDAPNEGFSQKLLEDGITGNNEEIGDWSTLRTHVSRSELIVRCAMSFFVNGIMRKLTIALVPLMLITVESSLDLVQNASALTFLVMLDDVPRSMKMRLKKVGGSNRTSSVASSD